MVINWYITVSVFVVSFFVTFVLWKTGFLKIFRKPYEALGEFADEKAVFKLNKIFEAEIPKWMARPPLAYAICFLIVCIGIGLVILAISTLL